LSWEFETTHRESVIGAVRRARATGADFHDAAQLLVGVLV
jgi:hypothetical protein